MNIPQLLQLAVEHHQAGRWIEANKLYKQILAIDPDEPDALRLLGQLTFASGSATVAAELIRRAISLRPGAVDFHIDLARICVSQGKFAEAVASFRRALELDPAPETHFELARALAATGDSIPAIEHVEISLRKSSTADALALLGGLLLSTGRIQQAVDRLQSAARLAPDRADILCTYALALQHRGDFDLAETIYHHALQLKPDFAEARNNLGHLLILRRKLPEALIELQQAIRLRAGYPQAHHNLALAFTGLGQVNEALDSYRTALEQEPNMPDAWEGLGRVLLDLRKFSAAVTAFTRAVALRPVSKLYILLSIAHAGLEDLDHAIAAAGKAVEIDPQSADTHSALGGELKWAGQLESAIVEFEKALELNPRHHAAHCNMIYTMLSQDGPTPAEILAAHVEWGRRHTGSIVRLRRPRNRKLPDRRLRVGYISPNFRRQAVSSFVLPILEHHDRTAVEIFCYSDLEMPDDITRRIEGYADQWRECAALTDEQLARQIRENRVDILIELTGHIGKGRLGALAHRPSPVQISYIGYQGTTGVSAVDYVLTDDWADPPGAEKNYIEKPFRLPGSFFVYEPPKDAPLVAPLPAKTNGYVTFGCLNAVNKITARTLSLWSAVMARTPASKIIVLTTRCEETNHRLLAGFAAGGIAADRVQLVQRSVPDVYFRRYNSIDIALDPVPFNGHTTTCDAAWMGCPTVTLSGQIYAHRFGGTVMRNCGLAGLVTETPEAYVHAAVELAGDLASLAQLRSTLRFTMQKSLITDGPAFTRNLEQAYRQMWQTWCNTV